MVVVPFTCMFLVVRAVGGEEKVWKREAQERDHI